MALVKCKYCENEISDTAKKCPQCGKKVNKRKWIPMAIISLILLLIGVGTVIFIGVSKMQEEKRQEQIALLMEEAELHYNNMDFDAVTKCYDELEILGCDMDAQREILEYDIEMAPIALGYYEALTNADEKLKNYSYTSLTSMINQLKIPTQAIMNAEVNINSEIGKYIQNVRTNLMFQGFNELYLFGDIDTVDSPLTQIAHAYIMQTYTECILEEEFPYK